MSTTPLPEGATTPTTATGDGGWLRLDLRMLLVAPLQNLLRLIPVVVVLLFTGRNGNPVVFWTALGTAVLIVVAGVLRWTTTRYRLTPDRLELRSGLLFRQRRSVPRDRIRAVDLTAPLLHRICGLTVVKVSGADSSGVTLDAVAKGEADRLRRQLLQEDGGPAPGPLDAAAAGAAQDPSTPEASDPSTTAGAAPPIAATSAPRTDRSVGAPRELARLSWSWLRYAPLTVSSLAAVGAAAAALFNLIDQLGVAPDDLPGAEAAADQLSTVPLWLGLTVVGVILLVVAVVGALILYAERWWDYRLQREQGTDVERGDTLRVRRGLLTRRSSSVAEARLRGVELIEPLLLRAGRGAQVRAVATGLAGADQGGALQPPAPRAEAHRVASVVLRDDPAHTTAAALRRHPPAAIRRRWTRALGPAAVLVAGGFVIDATTGAGWVGPACLVLLPIAALLAADRARSLGHQLTAAWLVLRQGSLVRRTVVLQRSGVIGWRLRQSPWQRRGGVITVEAVTAAGAGGYAVPDVAVTDAGPLADATTPALLTPWLPH